MSECVKGKMRIELQNVSEEKKVLIICRRYREQKYYWFLLGTTCCLFPDEPDIPDHMCEPGETRCVSEVL